MQQISFSDVELANQRKRTRREVFLAEMDKVVPWTRLTTLSDPAMEESLYDITPMRRFAGLNLPRFHIQQLMHRF